MEPGSEAEARLDRRAFLAAGVAVGVLPKSGGAQEGEARGARPAAMPTRRFGKTGVTLPMLAYGGAALPRAWLNPLSTEDRVELVRYAYARVAILRHGGQLPGEPGDSG